MPIDAQQVKDMPPPPRHGRRRLDVGSQFPEQGWNTGHSSEGAESSPRGHQGTLTETPFNQINGPRSRNPAHSQPNLNHTTSGGSRDPALAAGAGRTNRRKTAGVAVGLVDSCCVALAWDPAAWMWLEQLCSRISSLPLSSTTLVSAPPRPPPLAHL